MKGSIIRFVVMMLAFLASDRTPPAQSWNDAKQITGFSLVSRTISLHEPVWIALTVRNSLTEELKLNLGQDKKEAFRIAVTYPNGKHLSASPFEGVKEGIRFPGVITIGAGDSFQHLILVNEWYEFSELGEYMLEVELENPIETPNGNKLDVELRDVISLTVTKRDPDKLRGVCRLLLDRLSNAQSYQEAADAALALSYINDPIAVPYLEQILRSDRMVEREAIQGLSKIGDVEAVRVLIATMRSSKGEAKTLARSALINLESQSTDPEIKEVIRRATRMKE